VVDVDGHRRWVILSIAEIQYELYHVDGTAGERNHS
jgi:hypothetical protein